MKKLTSEEPRPLHYNPGYLWIFKITDTGRSWSAYMTIGLEKMPQEKDAEIVLLAEARCAPEVSEFSVDKLDRMTTDDVFHSLDESYVIDDLSNLSDAKSTV